jgi:hypothetical protein
VSSRAQPSAAKAEVIPYSYVRPKGRTLQVVEFSAPVHHCGWDYHPAVYQALVVEQEPSRHYASIRAAIKKAARPIASNDLWIAARARTGRMVAEQFSQC